MAGYHVHLVGSVPLRNAKEVFQAMAQELGPLVDRLPDGETGERSRWMGWLDHIFAENPQFEPTGATFKAHATADETVRYRLAPGVTPTDIRFDNLRHAMIALDSYREFSRLKQADVIAPGCKYQFAIAHPLSVIRRYLVEELHATVTPLYEAAVLRQIETIAATIPHDQLAIQWDCASVIFTTLQRGQPTWYAADKASMHAVLGRWNARLGDAVPADIDLVYHFCYGSSGNRHTEEPVSMADMVEQANRIAAEIHRSVEIIHMPVPIARDDDAYFAPLGKLALRPGTQLSLGLIHDQDGIEGTTRRLAGARRYVTNFLIAAECGFGRRTPESLAGLLEIHRGVAALG